MAIGHQSFYQTALTSGISASDLIIPLDTVPTVSEGFLVIESTVQAKREIIYFTSKDATTVTCPSGAGNGRGYDGTTAVAHLQGATVIMAPVGVMFEKLGDISVNSITINDTTSAEGWSPLGATPDTVTANGNKSYDLVFNSTDLTDTITNGMRVRAARTVAAPTQCTSLNGTTQYYSKSSPSGMTFTDNFTCTAWVKLNSYAGGGVLSRYVSATSGWSFKITSSGQVLLEGANGGNNRYVTSYQSLPLNKWVHIAATLTMGSNTGTVYIDGVLVPSVVAGSATSLVQGSGTFNVGAVQGASFFDGKIAQASVYSAVLSGATILAAMNQGLAGTETNLISAYNLSNSLNDLSANANNLTAQGSATTTTADAPWGNSGVSTTYDYGVVMDISFSTNTTLTIQVPEGCTIPSSGGVSTVDYSTQNVPYGFPRAKNKWSLIMIGAPSTGTVSSGVWTNYNGLKLVVPVGLWGIKWEGIMYQSNSSSAGTDMTATLSTTTNTETDNLLTGKHYNNVSTVGGVTATFSKSGDLSLSSATPYYLVINAQGLGTITSGWHRTVKIVADNAYL